MTTRSPYLVVVADPDQSLLGVLSLVLPQYGMAVQATPTVAGANAILARSRPDVVVLDESLLHDDPDGLVRRGTDRLIVTISDSGSGSEARAVRHGADAWLRKPFAMDDLLALLLPSRTGRP